MHVFEFKNATKEERLTRKKERKVVAATANHSSDVGNQHKTKTKKTYQLTSDDSGHAHTRADVERRCHYP